MVRPLVPLILFPIVHGDNQFVGRLCPEFTFTKESRFVESSSRTFAILRRFSGESAVSPYLCLLLLHNALSKTKVKEARVPTLLSPHCWGPRSRLWLELLLLLFWEQLACCPSLPPKSKPYHNLTYQL